MPPLYRLLWDAAVQAKLNSGAATLMTDPASGLPFPVAKVGSQIVGLPRLVQEAATQSLGGFLTPVLAGANLLATVGNIWLTAKVRGEVKSGFAEMRTTLRGVQGQLDDIGSVARLGVALVARLEEQQRLGFGLVLAALAEIAASQARIESLLGAVYLSDVHTAVERLAEQQARLALLLDPASDFKAPDAEAMNVRRVLEDDVIPVLRKHALQNPSYGYSIPFVILAANAYQTLARAGIETGERVVSRHAFQSGQALLTETLERLLDPSASPFEFLRTGVPAAQLLIATRDSLRLGELAVDGADADISGGSPVPPGEDFSRLSSFEFPWPRQLEPNGTAGWSNYYSGPKGVALARRITGCPQVGLGRTYCITTDDLARTARVPDECLPTQLTPADAGRVTALLHRAADPAEIATERKVLAHSAGLSVEPDVAAHDLVQRAWSHLVLTRAADLTFDDVLRMDKRTLVRLAEQAKFESDVPSVLRCNVREAWPSEVSSPRR